MGLTEKYKKELEVYDNPDDRLNELSIQESLTILTVYITNLNSEDSQQDVEQIVKLLREHPLFEEISEDEQSTWKRINRYLNMMQDKDYIKEAVDRAVDVLLQKEGETAFKLTVKISKTLGLTEARKQNLRDLATKLSIGGEQALEIIQSG